MPVRTSGAATPSGAWQWAIAKNSARALGIAASSGRSGGSSSARNGHIAVSGSSTGASPIGRKAMTETPSQNSRLNSYGRVSRLSARGLMIFIVQDIGGLSHGHDVSIKQVGAGFSDPGLRRDHLNR